MSDVRLIDANAMLIQAEHLCASKANYDFLKRWVDAQRTAYDIDKVVEEIKANAKTMSEAKFNFDVDGGHAYYKAIGTRKCEEIIRGGLKC